MTFKELVMLVLCLEMYLHKFVAIASKFNQIMYSWLIKLMLCHLAVGQLKESYVQTNRVSFIYNIDIYAFVIITVV